MFQPHVLRILFLNFVIDQQHAWTRLAWATRKRRKQGNHFCVKTNLFFSFFFFFFSSLILNVSNENKKITSFCRPKLVTVTTVFCIQKQCFSLSSFLHSCCPWFLVSLPDNQEESQQCGMMLICRVITRNRNAAVVAQQFY